MASIKESAIRLVLKAKDSLSGTVKKSAESLQVLKAEANSLKQKLATLEQQQGLLASFEKQKVAVRDAGKAFREAETHVERLAKEYRQADKPTKAMQKSLNSARQSVIKANKAYQTQRKNLADLRSTLHASGLSTRQVAKQQKKLSDDIKKTAASYEKVNAKAKQANKTLRSKALKNAAKDANKASSSINRLSQRFAGLIAASVGLYSIKRAIGGILGTGDKFERLSVQLEAITGSMAEGDRALAWIKEFTKNTPYQLHEVAESFVRLKAFGLDPMDGSMQAIVDQASLLGGGFDRLRGISVGLGQAWAKQRLQGEEILQLVERGIPVWEHLGNITGKSALEIRKLSEAGKLGRDVIADLIKEIGKSADGAALKNMSLLSGYVSNLKDSWSYFLAEIAESGALDYAKNELKKLSEQISIMNANGSLSKLATSISNGFISMAETIKLDAAVFSC